MNRKSLLALLGSFVLASVSTQVVAQTPAGGNLDVPGQPLASNVRRLLVALDSIGHPLSAPVVTKIGDAMERQDADQIQRELDKEVLAVVTINPEERVSVRRGSDPARIQQQGYRPAIIKVINHSTSTARLNVSSPQAGPVYAGASEFSMRRQRQTQLAENQNEGRSRERFLAIQLHDSPPMTPTLSGLTVEYVIVLLASNEAGKREAILHFDIGDGTADLEHRNELPVLFDVAPSVPVKLSIQDFDGKPTIAKLEFRDSLGRVYPLQAKRLAPDFFFQPHVYRADGETVDLPPGTFSVQYSRGPEYRVKRTELRVDPAKDNQLAVRLERWVHPRAHGFFSGDHHIHAAGCAHYTHPTEGVTPQDMFRQVQGEGLNVGCVLTWGPCFEHQRQYFNAQADLFGTRDTLLKYDLEISGFGSQALGHVCLLNLRNQTYPQSDGTQGWPTWTTPVMRWAKVQGGYAGYAHSASGLSITPLQASMRLIRSCDHDGDQTIDLKEAGDTLLPHSFEKIDLNRNGRLEPDELVASHRRAADELPNFAIPEMNGVGAMEICVSSVAGVCDFISAMDTARIPEWNTWYHLLNCGFPLKVSGETDFPCMSSRCVGRGRVYVQLGKDAELDFERWCRGLAEGRSYVSDGYAHLARMNVNGVSPGGADVELDRPSDVTIVTEVSFAPEVPSGVAYGTEQAREGKSITGDTVELHGNRTDRWVRGGERKVEIVVNGIVAHEQNVPADGNVHLVEAKVPVKQSSWIAVRHFPQLHSNPVNVLVADKPIRASKRSARWCADMTRLLWVNREQAIAVGERVAAKEAFDKTIEVFGDLEKESTGD